MKTSRPRVVGVVILAVTLLVAVCIQAFGRGLVWIDRHPATSPEIAARGGVAGIATHISFAVAPLVIALIVGLICLFLRNRDESPQG